MRTVGALLPDSDIQVISELVLTAGWEWRTAVEARVTDYPTGATFSFAPLPTSDNDSIWIFRTDTLGSYDFSMTAVEDHPYGPEYGSRSVYDTGTFVIAAAPVAPITQTHTLVDNEINSCSLVGILVETDWPFNVINEVSIVSTTSYLLTKGREEDLMITVEATDTSHGTSALLNREYASSMGDVSSWGQYLEVEVTEGVSPNLFTYDFGAGFQSLNKFSYPSAGTYQIQVKDAYGCLKQISHTANEIPVVDPADVPDEFYVSKANSFRFVKRELPFDDCSTYKKDENTFDSELEGFDLTYCYKQRFKKCQDLISQFKSNYTTHTAEYYNITTGAGPIDMPVTLKQTNLGTTDLRYYKKIDDTLYSYIYFDNGVAPYFYEVGGLVTVNGTQTQILGYSTLEDENAIAIKVALLPFTSNPGQIAYTFNKQNYNVYEFTMPVTGLGDGEYYIEINGSKVDSDPIKYQTPIFFLDTEYERTVDIMYYNESNTDMYYVSGIKNFITVGYEFRKPLVDAQLNVVQADYTNYLTSSFNVEKFELKFEPLTMEIMRKTVIALCHERLFIDSVGYSVSDITLETIDDNTNLYVITATLNKSNFNVKFISTGANTFDWSSGQITFDSSITFDATTYGN